MLVLAFHGLGDGQQSANQQKIIEEISVYGWINQGMKSQAHERTRLDPAFIIPHSTNLIYQSGVG